MNTTTLVKDLTETQILTVIRKVFEGERVTGIELDTLINQSETLGDLFAAVRRALDEQESAPAESRSF